MHLFEVIDYGDLRTKEDWDRERQLSIFFKVAFWLILLSPFIGRIIRLFVEKAP